MRLEGYESESENSLAQKMDYFSDEQLKNNTNEEDKFEQEEQKDTEYQNIFGEVSQNKANTINNNIENSSSNLIITLYNNLTNCTSLTEEYKRRDNLRKETFYILMIYLKQFFKERYGLNFDSFKCDEVFGVSIGHMKKVLGLEIYQILCYYPENIAKIINYIEKVELEQKEKLTFFYFMTRTYEELYKRYINGDVNFPIIKDGTIRINKFITLKKVIKEKTEKLQKQQKTEKFIGTKIMAFSKLSKNMINDIKNGNNERKERKGKEFIIAVIDEFEIMKKNFLENNLSLGIELEE
jgi:hypothetical protein